MRRLTAEEKSIFPGLKLVIQAKKVRITQAPSVLPCVKGWVVWIAETYPGWCCARPFGTHEQRARGL